MHNIKIIADNTHKDGPREPNKKRNIKYMKLTTIKHVIIILFFGFSFAYIVNIYTIDATIGGTKEYEKSIANLGVSAILNIFDINSIPKAGKAIINLITIAASTNTS